MLRMLACYGAPGPTPKRARQRAVLHRAQDVPSEGQEVGGLGRCGSLGHLTLGEVCEQSLCLGESLRVDGGGLLTSRLDHGVEHRGESRLDEERATLGPLDVLGADDELVADLLRECLAEDGHEHGQCVAGLEVHEDGVGDETIRVLRLDPHGVLVLAGVEPACQICHDVPPSTWRRETVSPFLR